MPGPNQRPVLSAHAGCTQRGCRDGCQRRARQPQSATGSRSAKIDASGSGRSLRKGASRSGSGQANRSGGTCAAARGARDEAWWIAGRATAAKTTARAHARAPFHLTILVPIKRLLLGLVHRLAISWRRLRPCRCRQRGLLQNCRLHRRPRRCRSGFPVVSGHAKGESKCHSTARGGPCVAMAGAGPLPT